MDQKMSDDLTEQRSDGPKRTGLEQVRTPDILFGIAPEGITVKNQRRITMNRLRRRMLALLLTAVMVVQPYRNQSSLWRWRKFRCRV